MAAASGEQAADRNGRIRTQVVWGQGIPLRPAMTIRRVQPSHADKAAQTTSQVPGVQTSILSNILPGHASVTDAVTRLQRERDLALRRVDELHDYYKKEIQKKDDADRKAMSLVETQKLSIKLLQDELGEEAEFDAEETAQMRSVRRECETRVNNYEDRMAQLQSDIQKEVDKQVYLL